MPRHVNAEIRLRTSWKMQISIRITEIKKMIVHSAERTRRLGEFVLWELLDFIFVSSVELDSFLQTWQVVQTTYACIFGIRHGEMHATRKR